MIDQILTYNARFVAEKGYEPYVTDKFPAKKLAVLTCMDTRLTELLPKALGPFTKGCRASIIQLLVSCASPRSTLSSECMCASMSPGKIT